MKALLSVSFAMLFIAGCASDRDRRTTAVNEGYYTGETRTYYGTK